MKKPPKYFLLTRLRGIWLLLTKRFVVVMGSNNKGDLRCYYNVTHKSFRLMCNVIDPAYEQKEGGEAALDAAKQILSKT